jgi:DNA-binding MarR family transcriptional regulator
VPKKLDDSPARLAYLNLVKAYEALHSEFSDLFREHGVTHSQFDVLRTLAGAPECGASCQFISENLLNRLPDVTRLLDRMERDGLVERSRCTEDRRVVRVHLTTKATKLLEKLEAPVLALHERQFEHMSSKAVNDLQRGLAAAVRRD